MVSSSMPFTGLYDERGTASPASLIHCSVEVSIHGLRNLVSLGFLFQNTSQKDFADAVFHCRLAEDSSVTFIDCSIEKSTEVSVLEHPEERLENRMCSNILHFGSFFQCNIGCVEAGKDAVIFIRYIYETVPEENAVHLFVPLPSSPKGGMNSRAHEMYPVENATVFSFNVESAMPGLILDVRSDSHSINPDIESNTAIIQVNEPVLPGNDDFQLTFFTENLSDTDSISEGGFTDFSECFHNDDTDISECYTPIIQDHEASTTGRSVLWRDLADDQFTGRSFLFAESDDESDDGSYDGSDNGSADGHNMDMVKKLEEEEGNEEENSYTYGWGEEEEVGEEEMEEEEEEFYDCLEIIPERLMIEWTRVRDSMASNGRSSRFTWYDDSDGEDNDVFYFEEEEEEEEPFVESEIPLLSIGTFYDSTVEIATVASPTRAAVIDIRRRSLVSLAPSVLTTRSRSDSVPLTPPSTPQVSNPNSPVLKPKRRSQPSILTNLRELVVELETQLRNSSSIFLELNESFSKTIGIPLSTLKQHEEDVQSAMIPEVRQWVRSGIWASLVALHYLEFSGCKELAEKDPDFAEDYGYLCFCLNGPLLRSSNWVQSKFEGLALSDLSKAAHKLFWTTE